MKKILKSTLTFMLVLVSVLVLVACNPTGGEDKEQTLIVGSPEISGNFMTGWGNSAYDVWVRDLIFSYGTYVTNKFGQIVLNPTVVDSVTTATDAEGNKTYTFVIHDDLLWSDDTPITAKDFVFSILMQASANWRDKALANSSLGDGLLGYAAYRGTTAAPVANSEGVRFAGVKLISDTSFSLTIDKEILPYFYETAKVSVAPLPMHRLAAEGATIDSNASGATMSAGALANVRDHSIQGGYRYAPDVTSGPYKFVSFVNQVVTLVKDDNFKGNFEGKIPTIQNIIIKRVNSNLDVDLVISGEIDLVTGVIEGSKIQAAQNAATTDVTYYSRNGYGYFAMQAHFGPTMDYKVRQAIAHITDRQYVADVVLEGYGSIVYSEYGLAQWMYVESEDWIDANINKYDFSITQANAILDTTEWKFEADGTTPFDPAKATGTYFRHNASGEVLQIRHLGTEDNAVTDSLEAKFVENMPKAGIKYDVTKSDFATLLDHYYEAAKWDDADKVYHTFNLATTFSVTPDPYYSWHSSFIKTDYNPIALIDNPENPAAPLAAGEKTIDELVVLMRSLDGSQTEQFLAYWREYQLRWNKLIPSVPLYSNQYYDVFDTNLKGVETTPFWNWAAQIVDMYFE